MIRPKPKPSAVGPRTVATFLTLALLLGAQAGLEGIALPAFASGRAVIRELDPLMLERFAVPPTPAPESTAEDEDEPAPREEEVAPTVTFDDEVGRAVEQLGALFGEDETPMPAAERPTEGAAEVAGSGITEELSADRFESLFGAGDAVAAGRAGVRRPAGARGGAGVGLGIDERRVSGDAPAGSADSAGGAGPDVRVSTGADRSATGEAAPSIEDRDPEAFDGSEADRLGVWMRSNPSELPVGVRVHMNYEPSFLTSATRFTDAGRTWELYLMYNQSLREVHVVLIEGDRSVYLIDRGFQEQSRSLREGTVRRSSGEIVAIDSRSGAASGEQAREFYDVFLSWWEVARAEVGGG